jgi:FHA domain-containing protein
VEEVVFLIRGPKRSARLHLEGPFFVIGRAEPFPVFHDDPTLSREHAAVVDTPEGYRLKDLGSRNGVLLNGERLDSYAEVPIAAGDVFQAGDTQIAIVTVSELEAARAEAEASAESITVDEAGKTGYQPAVQLGEDEYDGDFEGEVTAELERPELRAGRELALPMDGPLEPGEDAAWTDESSDDLPEEEPEELGEDDLLTDDLDDLEMEEVEDDDEAGDLAEVAEEDLDDLDDLELDDLGPMDDSDLEDLDDPQDDAEEDEGSELRRRPIDDLLDDLPSAPASESSSRVDDLDDLLE